MITSGRYLDELEHRFNNRENKFLFRDTLLNLVKAEKLPYAELTKAAQHSSNSPVSTFFFISRSRVTRDEVRSYKCL